MFQKELSLQAQLFLLMGIGYLLKKIHLIKTESQKFLSNLVIDVILPCNIAYSFMTSTKLSAELFRDMMAVLLIGTGVQLAAVLCNRFLFRKAPKEQADMMSFGMLCSNSSFIGIPMAEALFGTLGVVYVAITQLPIRITVWTIGVSYFEKPERGKARKNVVLRPVILAIFIGVLLMAWQPPLPAFVTKAWSSVSACCTPLSMITLGAILADVPLKSLFSRRICYFSFLRLIAWPLLTYLVCLPLPVNETIKAVTVLLSGIPAGCSMTLMAEKYGVDSGFSAKLVFTSTLLSLFTMPLLMLLLA